MKKLFSVCLLFFYVSVFSQKKLNSYQYAIVSDKFDFLKKSDMYQTSSLTKFLLKKNGFEAFLSTDSLPKGIYENRCAIVFVKILSSSGSFVTKNVVEFRDCNNAVVYTSKVGKSREKEYKSAYHQAIREAFKDVNITTYKWTPLVDVNTPKTVTDTVQKGSVKKNVIPYKNNEAGSNALLSAQPIVNGYQLVNTEAKRVVHTILNTGTKNLFIIKNRNGILYLKNSEWIAVYYENGQLIQKELNIKF